MNDFGGNSTEFPRELTGKPSLLPQINYDKKRPAQRTGLFHSINTQLSFQIRS